MKDNGGVLDLDERTTESSVTILYMYSLKGVLEPAVRVPPPPPHCEMPPLFFGQGELCCAKESCMKQSTPPPPPPFFLEPCCITNCLCIRVWHPKSQSLVLFFSYSVLHMGAHQHTYTFSLTIHKMSLMKTILYRSNLHPLHHQMPQTHHQTAGVHGEVSQSNCLSALAILAHMEGKKINFTPVSSF